MNTLPKLLEATPVFLYDGKTQTGPIACREVWAMRARRQLPQPGFFWAPGMPDWLPVDLLPEAPWSPPADTSAPPSQTTPSEKIPLATPQDAALRQPAVLVVDDDIIMCELISELIRSKNIHVQTAATVKEAEILVEKLGMETMDAVITDFEMPDGTGVELVRWLKQRDRALQVIMLTAQDNKEVVKLGLRSGILDFLEKPVRKTALMNALDAAISQTARQREERAAFMEVVRQRLVGKGVLAEQVLRELAQREAGLTSLLAKLDTISQYSAQLENHSPDADTPFSGKLGDLSVMDIVQMLLQSHKTGELRISLLDRTLVGAVYLEDGHIIHALAGNTEGPEALKILLQCAQGVFSFKSGESPARRTITGSGISALLTASSEIDHARPLSANAA
jgi:DNA-binding response OmpR family regulator